MNIKNIINFKMLREKGPKAIKIKDDEVVQLVSANKEILCIVTQEYLMKLLTMESSIMIAQGLKKEVIVDGKDVAKFFTDFSQRLSKVESFVKEDKKEFKS